MTKLKEIVAERLKQLKVGPVEAAVGAGIERTFIRDILEGKKKSVRADKMEGLARALYLDASALARGELVPADGDEAHHDVTQHHSHRREKRRPGDIPNFIIHAGMGPGGALSV